MNHLKAIESFISPKKEAPKIVDGKKKESKKNKDTPYDDMDCGIKYIIENKPSKKQVSLYFQGRIEQEIKRLTD
jgi:hypothetical protein